MNRLAKNLFELEAPESHGTKIYLRIFELFTVIYTIVYAWNWGRLILRISDVVLPLGLAQYVNIEIFFGNNLALYNAALISLLCIVSFFFKKVKWLYGIAFLLFHIQYVTRFCLGEIPHSQNFVGFCLLGLGLGSIFIKNKQQSVQFALGFVIFFIGLGYTTAGLSKLVATGVTWVDGNHLWLWIAEKSIDVLSEQGNFQYNWVQRLALQNWFFATLLLTSGLTTELLSFLVWWKPYRPYVFCMIYALHIGIYMSMNILFLSYMIGLIIIAFPWHHLFNNLLNKLNIKTDNSVYNFFFISKKNKKPINRSSMK